MTYFPQLVAGPIENPADLLPQLKKEHFWNKGDFFAGVRIALCGFFRKCVVADVVGVYVSRVFAGADSANALAIFSWPGPCSAFRCTAISPGIRKLPPGAPG